MTLWGLGVKGLSGRWKRGPTSPEGPYQATMCSLLESRLLRAPFNPTMPQSQGEVIGFDLYAVWSRRNSPVNLPGSGSPANLEHYLSRCARDHAQKGPRKDEENIWDEKGFESERAALRLSCSAVAEALCRVTRRRRPPINLHGAPVCGDGVVSEVLE